MADKKYVMQSFEEAVLVINVNLGVCNFKCSIFQMHMCMDAQLSSKLQLKYTLYDHENVTREASHLAATQICIVVEGNNDI